MKWCPDCAQSVPLTDFGQNRATHDGLTAYCKTHHNLRGRASRERNGGSRNYHLKRRYGISLDDFNRMLDSQGGVCAICQVREATDVDHCHKTGTVRGLLCNPCNWTLGHMEDDVELLRRAIAYLEGQ